MLCKHLNSVMKTSKNSKKNRNNDLYGMTGVFDNVGHHQNTMTRETISIYPDLKREVDALLNNNTKSIMTG